MTHENIGKQLITKAQEFDPSYVSDNFNDVDEALEIILSKISKSKPLPPQPMTRQYKIVEATLEDGTIDPQWPDFKSIIIGETVDTRHPIIVDYDGFPFASLNLKASVSNMGDILDVFSSYELGSHDNDNYIGLSRLIDSFQLGGRVTIHYVPYIEGSGPTPIMQL